MRTAAFYRKGTKRHEPQQSKGHTYKRRSYGRQAYRDTTQLSPETGHGCRDKQTQARYYAAQ